MRQDIRDRMLIGLTAYEVYGEVDSALAPAELSEAYTSSEQIVSLALVWGVMGSNPCLEKKALQKQLPHFSEYIVENLALIIDAAGEDAFISAGEMADSITNKDAMLNALILSLNVIVQHLSQASDKTPKEVIDYYRYATTLVS